MQGVAIVMPYGAHGRGSFERVRRIRIRILWGRRVISLFMPVRRCLRDRGVSGRKRRVLYGWIESDSIAANTDTAANADLFRRIAHQGKNPGRGRISNPRLVAGERKSVSKEGSVTAPKERHR